MNNVRLFLKKLKIHPLFWLVIMLAIMTGHFRQILYLFLAVFIHEVGHYVGAAYFRWNIKKMELFPFGGVLEVEEHGTRPAKEEVIVALLGPLQHIWLLAVTFWCIQMGWWGEDGQWFLTINVTLLLFNLLPIWPLDGGKLVFTAMTMCLPYKKAQSLFLACSALLASSLLCYFLIQNPLHANLWIIASFLAISHYIEWKRRPFVFMRFLMSRTIAHERVVTKPLHVSAEMTLSEVLDRFRKGVAHLIVIQGVYEQTLIEEERVLHAFFSHNQVKCAIGPLFR
ncbi:peptidase M50 [Fictibacillus macauensis ZFHKF-1]|uniref:Peptidase M50 n=1 Tax=Fictibacillus macauensis ZFHKF-1 TaxID=1196324 RepID=I8J0Q2_9BACL|nr:M50 family metallopeptidase [Fictibacillus macauensis]EIT85336.1 peptidase M50 [Fictibacillus macauensis ZFHKF-1]